ncbi:hypothetical protein KA977_12410 [Candidatus Dependentiae bacterium]|nr:hypothetical protein [Candidatus Dependentiae bacterium]
MIIDRVYVEEPLIGNFAVVNFLKNYSRKIEPEYFVDFEILIKNLNLKLNYESGKHTIVFKQNKGRFLKKCPCTSNVQPCGYYVLNIIQNCYIGCSYCYLQQYVNNNIILINPNIEQIPDELDELLNNSQPEKIYRLGSGEFSDSLLFDEYTGITEKLLNMMNKFDRIYFEIKTKTDNIGHLLKSFSEGNEKTVFAWSVNPQKIIVSEEPLAASLENRLAAAKSAVHHNYNLGFHFDPVIIYEGWEKDYNDLIEKIFFEIPAEKIMWFSIGSFRCAPELIPIIKKNNPQSKTYQAELIKGTDGKIRYPRFIRERVYSIIIDKIRKYTEKAVIYLCMENIKVWNSANADNPEKILNFKWR